MNGDSSFTTQRIGAGFARDDFYPDPNGPDGPWGPWGPVIRAIIGREALVDSIFQRFDPLALVGLNPQPLPPRERHTWAILNAQSVINQGMVLGQLAAQTGNQQHHQQLQAWQSGFAALVDDWCGNGRPRWPFPWPPPWGWVQEMQPHELIAAGTQFKLAAAYDSPLQSEFAAAADRLLQQGMSQLG